MNKVCTKCVLHENSKVNCMSGEGPEDAKIMLVGEGPGQFEEQYNRPFVGPAGQLLDSLLLQAGLKREEVRISNTVRCRPPGNRTPEKAEIEACAEYLDAEIQKIKPKVIIPLGATALYRILNLEKITKVRGEVYHSDAHNCEVIPSFHPAYVLRNRNPATEQAVVNDLIRAKTIATTGIVHQDESDVKYFVAKTVLEVQQIFKRLNEVEEFAVDTETTGFDFLNGKILCVSFSWQEKTGVCIPLYRQFLKPFWNTQYEEDIVRTGLRQVLENEKRKIFYNGKFDVKFFKTLGINVKNFVFDPMLAHHLLDENAKGSRGLEDLASLYLGIPSYKGEVQKYLGGNPDSGYEIIPDFILWPYACKDADLTFRLYRRFLPLLAQENLSRLLTKIVMPLQEVLTEMEYRGVKIDVEYVKSLIEMSERWKQDVLAKLRAVPEVLQLEQEMNEGKKKPAEFNFSSSQQVSKLLFEKLKLPTFKKTKANKDSVGAETLEQLKNKHRIIPLLIRYKKIVKLKSTYVDGVLEKLDPGGSLHTEYQVAGTVTGRLSSQSPNLQNIPRDDTIKEAYGEDLGYNVIKRMFLPRPDHIMVEADQAQIEYRVFANYVQDEKMIEDLRAGLDIHRHVASLVFKVPEEKITKEQRTQAKFVVFGVMYGRGVKSVAEQHGLTEHQAQAVIDTFLNMYPKARLWLAAIQRQAATSGRVVNLFGRIRRLPEAKSGSRDNERAEALRQSINAPIQGGAADITYIGLIRINRKLKELGLKANILLTVHDSIVLEVPKDELPQTIGIIKEEMTRPIDGVTVPLEVEIKAGENWGQLKEWKENGKT